MKESLTAALCTRCGLCCDGSLFADVELVSVVEASALEAMGLDIEEDDEIHHGLLLQPCGALKRKRCGIYPHRPKCCRTFECHLLQKVRRGDVSVDCAREQIAKALQMVERVKKLLARFGRSTVYLPLKERCLEVLARSEEIDADPETHRKRDELETAMIHTEMLIQKTFLGG